ncbi:MAG: hypothetical protein HY813_01650 [Candidatus Portnoybacteria bacterium]|nr:hypothetical protein [Candidatus Portnoybacteria bacterium]
MKLANPPNDNVEAPINIGTTTQYKSGALGIGGALRGYSNAIFDGNVGIGTTTPVEKLDVAGKGLADDFCTRAGICLNEAGGRLNGDFCICETSIKIEDCVLYWNMKIVCGGTSSETSSAVTICSSGVWQVIQPSGLKFPCLKE